MVTYDIKNLSLKLPMNKAQSISIFGLVLLFQFSLRAESNIIINEIHYDVSDKTLRAEFIELHNSEDWEAQAELLHEHCRHSSYRICPCRN